MSAVLVTAIGSVAGQEIIRSLKHAGYKVIGCDINDYANLAESRIVDRFYQVHKASDGEDYIEDIHAMVVAEDIRFIYPLTDVEVDLLDANRPGFTAIGAIVCMPNQRAVRIARNKKSYAAELSGVFEFFRIIPNLSPEALFAKCESDTPSRIVVKPENGRSSEGLEIVGSRDAMHAVSRPDLEECVIQPFIEGSIVTVDILRQASSGTTHCFPRREIVRTRNGIGVSVKTLDNSRIVSDCGKLAAHLGLNGIANVEIIESSEGFFLMDINPRFSAGIGFTRLAGYDIALNCLRCFTGEQLDFYEYKPGQLMIRKFEELIF